MHTPRHIRKNSSFSTQAEHIVLLGLEALTGTPNLRYATRSKLGRRHRAFIRDKAQAYWRRMGKFISQTAGDARQRAYGLIAETQIQIREVNVPEDTVLVTRVRAQIGQVVSQAGAVDVTAIRDASPSAV